MKIHTFRLGFATNSSSSHSVVLMKAGQEAKFVDALVAGGDFQWDRFTAASEAAKRDYLALTLRAALVRRFPGLDEGALEAIVRTYLSATLPRGGGIDHQSEMVVPRTFGQGMPSREFFAGLEGAILSPNVAILGGSDSSDSGVHHLAASSGPAPWHGRIPRDSNSDWVCASTFAGGWTLFDRKYGTKVRLSFEDGSAPTHSFVPELVDVKVTSRCEHGCSFCYQASCPKGEHADSRWLDTLVWSLERMGVFEVAIGGGDPLLFPELADFCGQLDRSDIVPNLTVRDLEWGLGRAGAKRRAIIFEHLGGLAVSVHTLDEAKRAMKLAGQFGLAGSSYTRRPGHPLFVVQHVVGLLRHPDTAALLKWCDETGVDITLLGWKATGRAKGKFRPHDVDLEKLLAEVGHQSVGIDACLASQFRGTLRRVAYPETFRDATEGAFSMYVDAVAKTAGPSSWCSPELVQSLVADKNEMLEDALRRIYRDGQAALRIGRR